VRLAAQDQKQLPLDDPATIPFTFYAVDEAKSHSELGSVDDLILIPVQLVNRLKNDDQIAAMVADGVAFDLHHQQAHLITDTRAVLAADAAGLLAGALVPGLS
jgi:hypothetical protein